MSNFTVMLILWNIYNRIKIYESTFLKTTYFADNNFISSIKDKACYFMYVATESVLHSMSSQIVYVFVCVRIKELEIIKSKTA